MMDRDYNIIKVSQKFGKEHKTRSIFQYDNGMTLRIEGIDLPETFRVDFANDITGSSKSMIGENSEVKIPYEYFVPGSNIHCWVVAIGEDYSTTIYHILIPVDLRAEPSVEEPTEEEVSLIDQTQAALNNAVEKAEESVSHYPRIENGTWEIWDAAEEEYISTGVSAGGQGITFTPHVNEEGIISWTNDGGLPNPESVNIKGPSGGFSPKASVVKDGLVTTITITDIDGTTTADIDDGVTFTPAVSDDGVLSWSNDGGKENPPSVNIRGPRGEDTFPGGIGAGFHNGIFRGFSLGSAVTEEQYEAISSGSFDSMFIGDYWTINSIVWRIAAFDYWYGFGNPVCEVHHVVIVPDTNLIPGSSTVKRLNNTATVVGGYVGTDFYTGRNGNTAKAQAKLIIDNAFGSEHILSHKEFLCNATVNGYESAGGWYDSDIELMSERMVYGTKVKGRSDELMYTLDNTQLPLFMFDRRKIANGERRWLRDVASETKFSIIQDTGLSSSAQADYTYGGICPAFGLVG